MDTNACKIDNLKEGTTYEIQVVAFNVANNFKSVSSAVYIDTLPKGITCQDQAKQFFMEYKADCEKKVTFDENKIRLVGTKLLSDLTPESVGNIDSIDQLNEYLMLSLHEEEKQNREYEIYCSRNKEELEKLYEVLNCRRKELEQESSTMAKQESDIKTLERRRDKLLFEKSKLVDELRSAKTHDDILKSKNLNTDSKLKKLKERKANIDKYGPGEVAKIEEQIETLSQELNEVESSNHDLVAKNKAISTENKEWRTKLDSLRSFARLVEHEELGDFGKFLTPQGRKYWTEIAENALNVALDFSEAIQNSLDSQSKRELTLRNELQRYLALQHRNERLRAELDLNYRPTFMDELQAASKFEICIDPTRDNNSCNLSRSNNLESAQKSANESVENYTSEWRKKILSEYPLSDPTTDKENDLILSLLDETVHNYRANHGSLSSPLLGSQPTNQFLSMQNGQESSRGMGADLNADMSRVAIADGSSYINSHLQPSPITPNVSLPFTQNSLPQVSLPLSFPSSFYQDSSGLDFGNSNEPYKQNGNLMDNMLHLRFPEVPTGGISLGNEIDTIASRSYNAFVNNIASPRFASPSFQVSPMLAPFGSSPYSDLLSGPTPRETLNTLIGRNNRLNPSYNELLNIGSYGVLIPEVGENDQE